MTAREQRLVYFFAFAYISLSWLCELTVKATILFFSGYCVHRLFTHICWSSSENQRQCSFIQSTHNVSYRKASPQGTCLGCFQGFHFTAPFEWVKKYIYKNTWENGPFAKVVRIKRKCEGARAQCSRKLIFPFPIQAYVCVCIYGIVSRLFIWLPMAI